MERNSSVRDKLVVLWKEGFFASSQTLRSVRDQLEKRGYFHANSTLDSALRVAASQKGFLVRRKNSAGWQYLQKRPPETSKKQRIELFQKYELHSKIKEVSFNRFEDGYYKESVQNALVEVIDQVKKKAGSPKSKNGHDLDGDALMNHLFSPDQKSTRIAFNELKDSLDIAEQRGIMYLFKGIVGIRDKKAHLNFIQDDPLKTLEYLSLASLLLRLLDEAK